MDAWNTREAEAVRFTRTLERQLDDLKERKRKLLEALIYHETLTRPEYDEMRGPLEDDLSEVQRQFDESRSTELDMKAIVDFAENLLLNAAGVWQGSSLNHKQGLQQVLFPEGVEYKNGTYRTPKISLLFNGLDMSRWANEGAGSATGNRTRV